VIGQSWSEYPLQASPPHNDVNKLVAALGAAIQHDATKSAQNNSRLKLPPSLPTFFEGQLRNPTYGRTRWERGRQVPSHKNKNRPSPRIERWKTGGVQVNRRGNSPRRHRTWIDENSGLLKPDESGKERSCHKCGGNKQYIATRFASGESPQNVILDMLDEQLTPREMATLHDEDDSETDKETGDDPSNVSASFEQAFETRFADRLGSKLTHFPGEDQ
jgi:hypothetical protein